MNLRKDHSHDVHITCISCSDVCTWLTCCALVLMLEGGGADGLVSSFLPSLSSPIMVLKFFLGVYGTVETSQLSATDVSARTTMKGAAKCDKHCELQNSVNQQGL